MKRSPLVVAAVFACFSLAAVLAVLSGDVLRWRAEMERSDLRFAAGAPGRVTWHADTRVRSDVSRRLLALDDDLALRRALALWRSAAVGTGGSLADAVGRAQAATALQRAARGDVGRAERSLLMNAHGVLVVEVAARNRSRASLVLLRGLDDFREAVRLDPRNAAAKHNLELALRLLERAREAARRPGRAQRGGSVPRGAGQARPGSGF